MYAQSILDRSNAKNGSSSVDLSRTRYKYFKTPVPLNDMSSTFKLDIQESKNEVIIEDIPTYIAEPFAKDVGVQTIYRDSETQTLPYTPQVIIPENMNPDLMLLEKYTLQNGPLMITQKDIDDIIQAKLKKDLYENLPPFTDEASMLLRKKLLESQEMKELHLRESELEEIKEQKLQALDLSRSIEITKNDTIYTEKIDMIKLQKDNNAQQKMDKFKKLRERELRQLDRKRLQDPYLNQTASSSFDMMMSRFQSSNMNTTTTTTTTTNDTRQMNSELNKKGNTSMKNKSMRDQITSGISYNNSNNDSNNNDHSSDDQEEEEHQAKIQWDNILNEDNVDHNNYENTDNSSNFISNTTTTSSALKSSLHTSMNKNHNKLHHTMNDIYNTYTSDNLLTMTNETLRYNTQLLSIPLSATTPPSSSVTTTTTTTTTAINNNNNNTMSHIYEPPSSLSPTEMNIKSDQFILPKILIPKPSRLIQERYTSSKVRNIRHTNNELETLYTFIQLEKKKQQQQQQEEDASTSPSRVLETKQKMKHDHIDEDGDFETDEIRVVYDNRNLLK